VCLCSGMAAWSGRASRLPRTRRGARQRHSSAATGRHSCGRFPGDRLLDVNDPSASAAGSALRSATQLLPQSAPAKDIVHCAALSISSRDSRAHQVNRGDRDSARLQHTADAARSYPCVRYLGAEYAGGTWIRFADNSRRRPHRGLAGLVTSTAVSARRRRRCHFASPAAGRP